MRVFGEPKTYAWGNEKTGQMQTFTKDKLPRYYGMDYGDGFRILMAKGYIEELRFEGNGPYIWKGGLHVGSLIEDVCKVVGQPTKTVTGNHLGFADGVLYEDADGRKSYGYYARQDQGIRMFLKNDKVVALYVMRTKPTPEAAVFDGSLESKVAQLDINSATLDDVLRIFGEPQDYVWGNEQTGQVSTFTKDELPTHYIMEYPGAFRIFMNDGHVQELRFERGSRYVWKGGLHVGSSIEDVLAVVGPPTKTAVGEDLLFEDGVLYKDATSRGRSGWGYYARSDQGVRMFFQGDRMTALYLTRTQPTQAAAALQSDLQAKVDRAQYRHGQTGGYHPPVRRAFNVPIW